MVSRASVRVAAVAGLIVLAGCSSRSATGSLPVLSRPEPATLTLDAELSPVTFRWLAQDAVLVPAKVGERKLAAFGNYIGRAAGKLERARVSVWDDEAAWKLASTKSTAPEDALAHKRAEFVKESAGPDPVERYMVFDSSGQIVYQRDFRSYPLTDLD